MRVCTKKTSALALAALYGLACIFGHTLHYHEPDVGDDRQTAGIASHDGESHSSCCPRHPSVGATLFSSASVDCSDGYRRATSHRVCSDDRAHDCTICAMLAQLRLAQPHSGVVVETAPVLLEAARRYVPPFSHSPIRLGDARGPPVS